MGELFVPTRYSGQRVTVADASGVISAINSGLIYDITRGMRGTIIIPEYTHGEIRAKVTHTHPQ